ncbi:MAG: hypothetical protein JW795_06225, partial [Chitinivibrionales bacterium]|nr:hypothetical protein [Chitinivibrionales bacterium]
MNLKFCVYFFITLIFFVGCSSNLIVKKDSSPEEIAICTQINGKIPQILREAMDSVTTAFIEDYNLENNKYRLIPCQDDNLRTLFIDVFQASVTDPGQQSAGIAISALGLLTPFAMISMGSPIYVVFLYIPRSKVQMRMRLSNDIAEQKRPRPRQTFVGSGQYFGSYMEQ